MTRLVKAYGLVALMVLVVTLMHYNTAMHIHAAHGIYRRLYYFPIIIAAFRGGRTAGLLTALAICLLYIPHAFGVIGHDPAPTLEKILEMVLYLAVGLVTGTLEDRDRRTRRRLQDSLDERERLELELVRRERLAAVGQLSAGLAHEIRNPLASIKGASEVLQDHEPPDSSRGRMLTIVREEAARLNDVLTRFLAFARPATGDRTRVDLADEVTHLAGLLDHRDQAPAIRIDLTDQPCFILADRDAIRQVLLNVGLNAAEAAGPAPDGTVVLALARDGSRHRITVTDNGPGFSAEAVASLGTPFFTTRTGGTGLGLATSLRIVRDHGGEITVDTDHHDGARVAVQLPAVAGERMMARVLLIDDDRNLREVVGFMLREAGHEVDDAGSAEEGLALFARAGTDLVLTDMKMPGRSGMDVLREVQPTGTPVVLLTAHGTVSQAVEAMRLGASSYLLKPFERAELLVTVEKALAEGALRRDNANLRDLLRRKQADGGIVYRSDAMARLLDEARRAAASDAPVLVTGESGTGKELIARLIHDGSPRWEGPFVAVNCGAIAGDLAESELFGHERGAFTGADRDHRGRIRAADGGTLLLDEIGDLPPALQPKFLRALETRQVDPVGATGPVPVDFRLVCATNRDLVAAARDGGFRDDLYYRIAIVALHVPPLRDRPEDVAPIWDHFTQLHGGDRVTTATDLRAALETRPWPGNVRELRNLNQRLVVMRRGDDLSLEDLRRAEGRGAGYDAGSGAGLQVPLPADHLDLPGLERELIRRALARFEGNKSRTAEYLRIPRHVLVYRLKKIGKD